MLACPCIQLRATGVGMQWWVSITKALAQLGAQHYQRPSVGNGIQAVIFNPEQCKSVRVLLLLLRGGGGKVLGLACC